MPRPNQRVAIQHPDGYMVVPDLTVDYPDDDPLVRAFPWLFEQPIERATARPGEKRQTRQ